MHSSKSQHAHWKVTEDQLCTCLTCRQMSDNDFYVTSSNMLSTVGTQTGMLRDR